MAKRPKSNSSDSTIRNVFIVAGALVFVLGAVLIWNNRALSYAGTFNGERMPISQLDFQTHLAWAELQWQFGGVAMDGMQGWMTEMGFESLVALYATVSVADEFGLSLADVDQAWVDERIELYRNEFVTPDFDMLNAMGFSQSSFRQFVQLRGLEELVREHVFSIREVSEEELEEAFAQFVEEHRFDMQEIMLHYIEVEDEALADDILNRILEGEDIRGLIEEYSVAFAVLLDDVEFDEFGEIVHAVDVRATAIAEDVELMEYVYSYGGGRMSMQVHPLPNGNFAVFEVLSAVDAVADMLELEETFKENHAQMLQATLFNEMLQAWISEADVTRNARIMGEA